MDSKIQKILIPLIIILILIGAIIWIKKAQNSKTTTNDAFSVEAGNPKDMPGPTSPPPGVKNSK